MEYALFSLPIVSGKSDAARRFLVDLEGPQKQAYAESERRLGITKEVWAIQHTPGGDAFVVFFQGDDIAGAVGQFVASQDEFDQWFKGQVLNASGVDINHLPPGPLSEILSVYEA
ncbi:MAG TPA: hypothetical protein VHX16_12165 [Chloroflexota bacterium]|jgi:hypothetical protein|nr:hypothetical protein [Chloroflexota bacterium]